MLPQEVAAVARENYRTSVIRSLNFQEKLSMSLNVGDIVNSDVYTLALNSRMLVD